MNFCSFVVVSAHTCRVCLPTSKFNKVVQFKRVQKCFVILAYNNDLYGIGDETRRATAIQCPDSFSQSLHADHRLHYVFTYNNRSSLALRV